MVMANYSHKKTLHFDNCSYFDCHMTLKKAADIWTFHYMEITVAVALFRVPVFHTSRTVCQHVQYKEPETEAPHCNLHM